MAKLDFPDPSQSPYEENGYTYEWDGSKWNIVATPGSGVNLTLQDVTDNGNTTNNEIIVSDSGNTATLGTAGTLFLDSGNSSNAAVLRVRQSGDNKFSVTADGGCYVGGVRGAAPISLNANGSADFDGSVLVGNNPLSGADNGVEINYLGGVTVTRAGVSNRLWTGYINGTSDPTSVITAYGDASFVSGNASLSTEGSGAKIVVRQDASAGNAFAINSGGDSVGPDSSFLIQGSGDIESDGGAEFGSLLKVTDDIFIQNGNINVRNDGDGTSPVYEVYNGGFTAGDRKAVIFADGNAEFVGGVFTIDPAGYPIVNRTDGNTNVFNGQLNGVTTSQIRADGSADFNAGKTTIHSANGVVHKSATGAESRLNGDGFYQIATDSSTVAAQILANGSAEFANDQFVIGENGNTTISRTGSDGFVSINSQGQFVVNGAGSGTVFRIQPAGTSTDTVTIDGNGNAVFASIAFGSATGNNSLDDYEEGTWTPTFANHTISNAQGFYTKVGSVVTVSARISWSAAVASPGSNPIGGFPFTSWDSANNPAIGVIGNCNEVNFGSGVAPSLIMGQNTATATMGMLQANGTRTSITSTNNSNAGFLDFTMTYMTDD